MSRLKAFTFSLALALALSVSATGAFAQAPPPPATTPNESALGTVEVNGSAGGWGAAPLPKLAVMPLITYGNDDSVLQLVVRNDLDLSGQFEVIPAADAPSGVLLRDTPVDWIEWKKRKVETVVRVFATAGAAGKIDLHVEAYVAPPDEKKTPPTKTDPNTPPEPPPPPPPPAKPAYKDVIVAASASDVRAASHRLVDALLGALTGRPGGFASQMIFSTRVGRWTQPRMVDADGFNLHAHGPATGTVMSTVFGPGGAIFYTMSDNFHRYRMMVGPNAAPVPIDVPGSMMGIAFSDDRSKLAFSTMSGGAGTVFLTAPTGAASKTISTAPLANYPAFGPSGQIAYVAGNVVQRVYVDQKPVSPAGFYASAPTFCDTTHGLLVIFTVGVGAGADIISVDTSGSQIRRLTQRMGSNQYPACSPDGRLVAFFSNMKSGKGPGLYVVPIDRPWLAKKISNEVGEGLRWGPVHTAKK